MSLVRHFPVDLERRGGARGGTWSRVGRGKSGRKVMTEGRIKKKKKTGTPPSRSFPLMQFFLTDSCDFLATISIQASLSRHSFQIL